MYSLIYVYYVGVYLFCTILFFIILKYVYSMHIYLEEKGKN